MNGGRTPNQGRGYLPTWYNLNLEKQMFYRFMSIVELATCNLTKKQKNGSAS